VIESQEVVVASLALHREMPFAGLLDIQLLEETPECVRARLAWPSCARPAG
jgi:hypothetical protein